MSQANSHEVHQHGTNALQVLRRRENLWITVALLTITLGAWIYTIYRPNPMGGMDGGMMTGGGMSDVTLFLLGWSVMMVAMMIPATLPLILLYRTVSRTRTTVSSFPWLGMGGLLAGYLAVWAVVGLPVYAYSLLADQMGSWGTALPAALLVAGGLYQFTALKRSCHSRCSSPLFFLMQYYKPGLSGAIRLGILHGIDCLGCCAGLMVGLVALGMMNLALMLTVTVIIFAEKTLPSGHRVSRPLGMAMVAGGILLLALSLTNGNHMTM